MDKEADYEQCKVLSPLSLSLFFFSRLCFFIKPSLPEFSLSLPSLPSRSLPLSQIGSKKELLNYVADHPEIKQLMHDLITTM